MSTPLSKANATTADHIQRKSRYAKAPIAPERTDDNCRWCGGRKNIAHFCQTGCFAEPVLFIRCEDCKRSFWTGKRGATLCHDCSTREHAAHVQAHASDFTPSRNTFWGRQSERVNTEQEDDRERNADEQAEVQRELK